MEPYLARLFSFWDYLLATYPPTEATQRILLVTHGGPIKTLLPRGLHAERGYTCAAISAKVPNCSVSLVRVDTPGSGHIEQFASADWLGDARLQTAASGDAEAVEPSFASQRSNGR
jgi:broad specificity phosphatase PhoE